MSKLFPKICYGFVLFVFILTLTSHSTLAASLDFSKGVMPDNPLYQLDLNLERIKLLSVGDDNQKQAELHLQYGTERLNELDYLAEKNDLAIDDIVIISDEYQKNISKFSKLISQKEITDSEQKASDLSPKIDELQAIQTKVVSKINEQPAQEEVKIIVKSTIQESQVDLMQAVVSVKKPIEEKVINEQATSTETIIQPADQETVKKLDETISNLNKQKNQLAAEIKEDEKSLKVKKEIADNQPVVNIDNTTKSTDNITIDPVISSSDEQATVSSISDLSIETNQEDNTNISDSPAIAESDATQDLTTDIAATVIADQWYYSPTCDYVSDKPGKDPVCGEEMIPISALPKDHTFFTKYIYKDGKYVQNVDDITQKKENDILKQAETPVIPIPVIIAPVETTTNENTPSTTADQSNTLNTQTTL